MAVTGTIDAETRRDLLVKMLAEHGQLRLDEATQRWDVHPMTIRRDFDSLERAGLARRVRGGIVSVAGPVLAQRRLLNRAAKAAIAGKLVDLLPSTAAIGLDASTTICALARQLPHHRGLAVVTNGLEAFEVLHDRPGVVSYLTGGEREEQNASLVGPLAIQALENFNLECCFLSALGVDAVLGTSESTLAQAAVKDAMVRSSNRVVVAVDASKLDTRSTVRSVSLDRVDVLVTELDPRDPALDGYRDLVETLR